MNYFEYRNDQLYAEDVPIADLARRVGTPICGRHYRPQGGE